MFRKDDRKGKLTTAPIPIPDMGRIVKDGVRLLGAERLEAQDVACHSLRPGFCSSAADRNMSIGAIRERSRHQSLEGMKPYLRGSQVSNYGI